LVEAFDDRDVQAFLEDRAALRAHAKAADIDHMRGVGEQSDDAAAMEGWRYYGKVVQMAGAEPGIVGDVVIALAHRFGGELAQEMPDAFGHGVDVAGSAGDGLGHHAAVQVEDASGEIAGLAHGGGEGGADHGLRLLFHDGDQAVPHDLAMDLRQGAGFFRHQVLCLSNHWLSNHWRRCSG
jgi:hypothetical protein